MNLLSSIYQAIVRSFADRKMLVLFIVLWMLFFAFMFLIPVMAVPGNYVLLQAKIYKLQDYVLLATLACMSALVFVIQISIYRQSINNHIHAGDAAFGGAGIFAGVAASIFATASCALCVGAVFSFLGFSTLLFLVESRWYIIASSLALLLISLYLSARRLNKGCEVCLVPH